MPSTQVESAVVERSPVTFDHLPELELPPGYVPHRPLGVAVAAVLFGLGGGVLIVAAVLAMLVDVGGPLIPPSYWIFGSTTLSVNVVLLGVGVALLVVADGLWRQEEWSLYTTTLLALGTAIYFVFSGSVTIFVALLIVLSVYLLAVRRYFV